MKTFITSYVISFVIVTLPFLNDVMARPLHVLPRLSFYFAFPLSIFVAAVIILAGSYLGMYENKSGIESQKPAQLTETEKLRNAA